MLRTARLRLRRLDESDAGEYARLIGDPDVMRFIGAGRPVSIDDAGTAIEQLNARYEVDGFGVVGVELADTGSFIGRVGLWVWNRDDWSGGWTMRELGSKAVVELGWALVRDAWGHGYATEAATAMRNHAFDEIGFRRLISLIHPRNERSLRVADRLGAVYDHDIETARWGPARLYVHIRGGQQPRPRD
jgi:RimJ/RimL family protein N-acetyltransferase